MKKIILSLTLVAFALVPALQAGDGKEGSPAKSSCPAQQATCPSQASSCCSQQAKGETAKSCCAGKSAAACGTKKARVTKKSDPSMKGAQLLVLR